MSEVDGTRWVIEVLPQLLQTDGLRCVGFSDRVVISVEDWVVEGTGGVQDLVSDFLYFNTS